MYAKLSAAVIAFSFVAVAHAEQPYGRDSVYASKNFVAKPATSAPAIVRYGRDSVYVTNVAAKPVARPVHVDAGPVKYGRA